MQEYLHTQSRAEGRDLLQVRGAGVREHAQYQRRRRVAGRHFDLRQILPDGQRLDQRGKLLRQGRQGLDQNFAALQVGDIGFFAFAKAGQNPAFLVDELDAEARPAPIGPHGSLQRRQHALRVDAADALQIIEQLPLLGRNLRLRRQMLQGASAANPEVRAGGNHAIGRGFQHLDEPRFVQLAAPFDHPKAHAFPGQRAVDEDGLAVDSRNPAAVVGQIHDIGFLDLARLQLGAGTTRPQIP